jgi:hypothetical protein
MAYHTNKFWYFNDITTGLYLNDAYNVIMLTKNGDIYMKSKDAHIPFLAVNNPFIIEFRKKMKYIDKHNETSFVFLMKTMEHIFKGGIENFRFQYIKQNRLDMVRAARHIENWWLDIIMSPYTKLGKRILMRDYETFSNEIKQIQHGLNKYE